MDTLTTYVNNTFSAVPQTEEIKKLKSEILNRMFNRYNILKSEGKSDNEITGIIISEFSNISELINEQVNIHNTRNSTYENQDNIIFNNNPEISEKDLRIAKALMNSFWPIVVVIYLLTSFLFDNWGISWIIFLIASAAKKFLCSYYDIDMDKKH